MLISNPANVVALTADAAAIKAVTDLIPDAGAMTSVKMQALHSGTSVMMPGASNYVTASSDAVDDAYGAYAELDASASGGLIVTAVNIRQPSNLTGMAITAKLAVGAGGSEVDFGEIGYIGQVLTSYAEHIPLVPPLKLHSTERLSIALKDRNNAVVAYRVTVEMMDVADLEAFDG